MDSEPSAILNVKYDLNDFVCDWVSFVNFARRCCLFMTVLCISINTTCVLAWSNRTHILQTTPCLVCKYQLDKYITTTIPDRNFHLVSHHLLSRVIDVESQIVYECILRLRIVCKLPENTAFKTVFCVIEKSNLGGGKVQTHNMWCANYVLPANQFYENQWVTKHHSHSWY